MPRTTLTRNSRILAPTLRGVARNVVRHRSELRHHVVRDAWTIVKRFGAETVINIEKREIPWLLETTVEGYLDDNQRLILAALAQATRSKTFFEIGTNRGRTTWTVARNNPGLSAFTLDVSPRDGSEAMTFELDSADHTWLGAGGACGDAFRGTPEGDRITQLWGDSATFDFSPFEGRMDLVYVDGAHTYDYVRSDTAAALRMLRPAGTIVWDDYTIGPFVYQYITELASTVDRPIYHIFGTRMAIYSRQEIVTRLPFNDHESVPGG